MKWASWGWWWNLEHRKDTEGKGHCSLLSFGEWRESFHANKSLNIEDKELIQTLGLYPACLLLPWHYRPAANSEQKGVINIFIWKQSINTGVIENLSWSRIFKTHLWPIDTSLSLIPQGYPCELLALTVAGIPSMHICLDFIPELIAQPELEKQVQCSHLAAGSLWVLTLVKYWLRIKQALKTSCSNLPGIFR